MWHHHATKRTTGDVEHREKACKSHEYYGGGPPVPKRSLPNRTIPSVQWSTAAHPNSSPSNSLRYSTIPVCLQLRTSLSSYLLPFRSYVQSKPSTIRPHTKHIPPTHQHNHAPHTPPHSSQPHQPRRILRPQALGRHIPPSPYPSTTPFLFISTSH